VGDDLVLLTSLPLHYHRPDLGMEGRTGLGMANSYCLEGAVDSAMVLIAAARRRTDWGCVCCPL